MFDVLLVLNFLSSIGSENMECHNAGLEKRNDHICRRKSLEVLYSNHNLHLCGERKL